MWYQALFVGVVGSIYDLGVDIFRITRNDLGIINNALVSRCTNSRHTVLATSNVQSQYECHDYLAKNKVVIVDSVLETFRNRDGKLLQNFEFYCESKSYVMEV